MTAKQRGRAIPPQDRLKVRAHVPKRAELPAINVMLSDGRQLVYAGLSDPVVVGPNGETTRLGWWWSADGLRVAGSMDRTPHGRLLHVSVSYEDHAPTWDDIKVVRQAFYPDDIDVAMMLPQKRDYVNVMPYCFHMWQTPVEWGLQ